MFSVDRKFHYLGSVVINKSRTLSDNNINPKDDDVNWLFLDLEGIFYSFVYKIVKSQKARYNEPFLIMMALTAEEIAKSLEIEKEYNLYRGQESIGKITLLEFCCGSNFSRNDSNK